MEAKLNFPILSSALNSSKLRVIPRSHRNLTPSPKKCLPNLLQNSPDLTPKPFLLIPPYISAKAWGIFNPESNEMLYGSRFDEKREIASLTKIMTCIYSIKLAGELDISYTNKITISKKAANIIGTSANLKEKDEIMLKDLFFAMMLPSGNDAAVALAEYFGGFKKEENPILQFVKGMNEFAKELNLENSVFKNPHGLSIKPNFSTVRDVCKLAAFALKNQFFCSIVNTKSYSCIIENPNGDRSVTWKTTNKLLGKGFDGIKTGHTIKAGPCLCVRTNNSNQQLIVTVLACKSYESRWIEVPKLASWAQKRFL